MKHIFPESCKLVHAIAPAANGSALTGDYISLKTAHKVWAIVNLTQANAATVTIGLNGASDVAGTGAAALTDMFKIWANQATATTDTLAKQAEAATFVTSAALANKQIVIMIDPAKIDSQCIALTIGASNAANLVQAEYYVETRYPGENPPSVIID